MIATVNFLLAFFFSFIGSIPPGTINLTCVQLGLERKIGIAWRFAILLNHGVSVCLDSRRVCRMDYLFPLGRGKHAIDNGNRDGCAGDLNTMDAFNTFYVTTKISESGFLRAFILSVLNPLAIPFWVGTTAYLNSLHWIDFLPRLRLHGYPLGFAWARLYF